MSKSTTPKVTGTDLMVKALEALGKPAHHSVIAAEAISLDKRRPKAERIWKGKTPEQTISAAMTMSHVSGSGPFVRIAPGCFALREWPAAQLRRSPIRPEAPKARASRVVKGGAKTSRRGGKRSRQATVAA